MDTILYNDTPNKIIDTLNNSITDTTSTIEQENLIDMLSNMGIGGNIVMAILTLLSILAIYILVERYFAIRKESLEDEDFLINIRECLKEKNMFSYYIYRNATF